MREASTGEDYSRMCLSAASMKSRVLPHRHIGTSAVVGPRILVDKAYRTHCQEFLLIAAEAASWIPYSVVEVPQAAPGEQR